MAAGVGDGERNGENHLIQPCFGGDLGCFCPQIGELEGSAGQAMADGVTRSVPEFLKPAISNENPSS